MQGVRQIVRCAAASCALWLAAQPSSGAPDPFLKADGLDVRNGFGAGDVVPLRGVNMGSWLLMEPWMCPMDASGLDDDWSVRDTLTARFGAATKDDLIDAYQDAWLQDADFDNLAALGMNCIRLPFWYLNLQEENGTWRADAFDRIDWMVDRAWQRGIYTILDLHGAPGGQRANANTTGRIWPTAELWSSSAYRDRTVEIWEQVSQHYNGNPAVAGYDLLNEPIDTPSSAAYWSLLDRMYQAIRTNDPDHIVIMEATYGIWNFDMLPNPASYGWSNVVYQLHAYPWSIWDDVPQLMQSADNTIQDWVNHQGWDVPCHIGEFNMGAEEGWKYTIEKYSTSGAGWQMWSYKATFTGGETSWGVYNPDGGVTAEPNIFTDSATAISNAWSQWTTANAFTLNPHHLRTLAMPVANDDVYSAGSGATLNVSAPGVLDNDTHLNLGGAGIALEAVKVTDPEYGAVALNADGSFSYTALAGFSGIDTFRYKVWDGRIDSARNATVSIDVASGTPGPAAQLIWTTQPGEATNGFVFGRQPVLQTADQFGTPTTNGLPPILNVAVVLASGTGPLAGTTNVNIGSAGGNGVVYFADLRIDSTGSDKQLVAMEEPPVGVSPNLLLNAGFEFADTNGIPENWSVWPWGSGGWATREINAKLSGGPYVAPMSGLLLNGVYDGSHQMAFGGSGSGGGGAFQIVPGLPGVSYTLGVQGGVDDWWLPTGEIRMFFLDGVDTQLALHVTTTTDSVHSPDLYDWGVPYQDWSLTATAPPGTAKVKVEIAEVSGTGSVWFDNAVLTSSIQPTFSSATSATFTVHDIIPVNHIVNLVNNGDATFTIHCMGTTGRQYYVDSATSLTNPTPWNSMAGSTTTVTDVSGSWSHTFPAMEPVQYFRSVLSSSP